jgi:hypothetical protein
MLFLRIIFTLVDLHKEINVKRNTGRKGKKHTMHIPVNKSNAET